MKATDPRSRAMLMCGVSGSGKTHYALGLESEGYERISLDAIVWERYGASFLKLPQPEQKLLFMDAMNEVSERMTGCLLGGKRVVVDATLCKRAVRDRLRDVCRKCGVEPIVVYFDVPLRRLSERLATRRSSGPDDLMVSENQLRMYYAGFERPETDETDVFTVVSEL